VTICEQAMRAVQHADAVVLVTEWPEFARLDWAAVAAAMARPLVVDGRNFLEPDNLRLLGFHYEGVGVPDGESDEVATAAGDGSGPAQ
jgi:UDPglucose 6-dehydrogenase